MLRIKRPRLQSRPGYRLYSIIAAVALMASGCWMSPVVIAQNTTPARSASGGASPAPPVAADLQAPGAFLLLLVGGDEGYPRALEFIDSHWRPNFVPMALDVLRLSQHPVVSGLLSRMLEKHTGQALGFDVQAWQLWVWRNEPHIHPGYAEFRATLYGLIDPRFRVYFSGRKATEIRIDEVVWGGVVQDGIPPLREPEMMPAAAADYLADSDVVFGIAVNGDVRAYPKRILAWHEMFVDTVGGEPVAGVYCTLCGTVILYRTTHQGVVHALGTSGFLYRSNKLMYDQATQSLWNTMWGRPVLGPLVERNIRLERLSIVTTTWGEWKRRHPGTQVLSLQTGHERDYAEGAAYRPYFATDELMFQVPKLDSRLRNKAEVLGLIFPDAADHPVALSAQFLASNPVHHDTAGSLNFVVFTDPSGANRVYASARHQFASFDGDRTVVDVTGAAWQLSESELRRGDGQVLARLPAHRAFWFGWYSAYPQTRLVN